MAPRWPSVCHWRCSVHDSCRTQLASAPARRGSRGCLGLGGEAAVVVRRRRCGGHRRRRWGSAGARLALGRGERGAVDAEDAQAGEDLPVAAHLAVVLAPLLLEHAHLLVLLLRLPPSPHRIAAGVTCFSARQRAGAQRRGSGRAERAAHLDDGGDGGLGQVRASDGGGGGGAHEQHAVEAHLVVEVHVLEPLRVDHVVGGDLAAASSTGRDQQQRRDHQRRRRQPQPQPQPQRRRRRQRRQR
eukprot:scaffold1763_cov243-Prasinococcus_capsulatus_cf.AAC.1